MIAAISALTGVSLQMTEARPTLPCGRQSSRAAPTHRVALEGAVLQRAGHELDVAGGLGVGEGAVGRGLPESVARVP